MPEGANSVLDRRTLRHSNSNLLSLVKPGNAVLDVGCGSGTITAGIAELTGAQGHVTGLDISADLIDRATRSFGHISNVDFALADINTYQPQKKYDVITSARVLQWVNNPAQIISKMAQLLEKDGCITILDYNHEKVQWEPGIPPAMQQFYDAFLRWRADAGMDNQVADHLETIMQQQGLTAITVTDLSERAVKGDPAFAEDLDIWAKVAEVRGPQLVQEQYITEALRLAAIADYRAWIQTSARSMTLYLLAVTGRV